MTKSMEFVTKTKYVGAFVEALHEMDGFGQYTYPDLTEYRGYFLKGKFHGCGCIELSQPYSMVFRGYFDNGKLVKLDEVMFKDGLKMKISMVGANLASNWKYCTEKDRRYIEEVATGLSGVGIDWKMQQARHTRNLPPNTYDTEEEILLSNGFLINIPLPFAKRRFLACSDEEEWVKKCCRTSFKIDPLKFDKTTVDGIINANINAAKRKKIEMGNCVCRKTLKRDYFSQMCERECQLQYKDNDASEERPLTDTSTSVDSFCAESLIDKELGKYGMLELAQLEMRTSR